MKILFLTDNFPPEVNAPANRSYDHCKEWVKQGIEVTVITCVPNFPKGKVYEGYKNRIIQKEEMGGIKVIRVWSYITANEGLVRRTLDYVSFSIMSFFTGLFQKTDLIVATSPQFFTAISGRWLSFFKRKPWVFEVRDLWPESIVAVGAMEPNRIIRFFEKVEKNLYKNADQIVVVTDTFKERISSRGINKQKIVVHKNGANLDLFIPNGSNKEIFEVLGIDKKTVFGYIGTHGMAHGLDFILECAKELELSQPSFHFLFLGDGAEKERLLDLQEKLGLSNVTFLPSVPKSEVVKYLDAIDVTIVNLKKSDTFLSVIPSKIFEAAAMKKPILLGVSGESKKIVEKYNAGLTYEPENKDDFIFEAIKITDPEIYQQCQKGCERLAKDFDRRKIALEMLEDLRRVGDE